MIMRYPGGKRRHTDRFIRPFFNAFYSTAATDVEYREPFVGAGSIAIDLLANGVIRGAWMNDRDPGIAALWNVIIERPDDLIRIVEDYRPTVEDFERYKRISIEHTHIDGIDDMLLAALAKLVTHQASYSGLGAMSGVLGGALQVNGNGEPKGTKVDSRWSPETIIENIRTAHRLLTDATLRSRQCTNLDFREVLTAPGEFIAMVDPPYYTVGKDLYLWHLSPQDHADLADILRSLQQPWLLTIDDCEEVRRLYWWAHLVPITATSSINGQGRQRELLVCSHEHSRLMDEIQLDLEPIRIDEVPFPTIPAEVYRTLPTMLKDAANAFTEEHERDIFLTGALPVLAGCMKNVVGDHGDGLTPLNLYTVIQGAAGTGKGTLRFARRLGEVIDERLIHESDVAIRAWHQQQGEDRGKEPLPSAFYLPANASVRALVDALAANGGHGVIHESELQTLVNTLRQGWGNFKDLLLKSFHQEAVTLTRKWHTTRILDPSVSMALSGTPESVRTLVQSQHDGLFSRIAFYAYDSSEPWRSQRPNATTTRREARINQIATRLDEMYRLLDGRRGGPLIVRFDDRQWDLIDAVFELTLTDTREGGSTAMDASIKRSAVMAFRVACILAVLRAFEGKVRIGSIGELIASDADVISGVALAQVYLRHAMTLAGTLVPVGNAGNRPSKELILAALSEEFTTAEAVEIGEEMGIAERTVKLALRELLKGGAIEKVRFGVYRKGAVVKTGEGVHRNGVVKSVQ